jgi:ribosomal protein S16
MLQIRLKRIGKAQKTVYSIVVTKKGDAINRGFLEKLGFFTLHYDR